MKKLLSYTFAGMIILSIAVSCGDKNGNKAELQTRKVDPVQSDSLVITVYGEDGKSILELTAENHDVDYIETSMGAFVKGIDSVRSGDGYNWFISVNDSMIKVASDKYVTKDGDTVRWHFREN